MILKGRKKEYWKLVELTWKRRDAIKKFFQRKSWDVLNVEHQRKYLKKFLKDWDLSE